MSQQGGRKGRSGNEQRHKEGGLSVGKETVGNKGIETKERKKRVGGEGTNA